jgi:molybdopterin biosynthesis enzyme
VIVDLVAVERNQSALAAALAATDADIVLVIGGTGHGPDDFAAAALAEAGEPASLPFTVWRCALGRPGALAEPAACR